MSATVSSGDRHMERPLSDLAEMYSTVHPGDIVLATFSPTAEPSILGIVTRVGGDSLEAFLFHDAAGRAVKQSGMLLVGDPRLDPGDAKTYFRGACAPIFCPTQITAAISEIRLQLAEIERKLERLQKSNRQSQ